VGFRDGCFFMKPIDVAYEGLVVCLPKIELFLPH
jgi:hypothetical protein